MGTAKGSTRITKHTAAKKALRAYVEALKNKNFKTWDELPEPADVRRENPGLENLWKQYENHERKFVHHWNELVTEILGLEKKPVVKSILKQPTVSFAADLEDETEDEEDDRSAFLESPKEVPVMNFNGFSPFADPLTTEDVPKEEKEGQLVPRADIAKKHTGERIEINEYSTDIDQLFCLAPEVFDYQGSKVAMIIFVLPWLMQPSQIVVEIHQRKAFVKFFTDKFLLHPSKNAAVPLTKDHFLYQKIFSFRKEMAEERGEKLGDLPFHVIELDLPFVSQPYLATDLLYGDKFGNANAGGMAPGPDQSSHIKICHTYVGLKKKKRKDTLPEEWLCTLPLIFKEEESNFMASSLMESMKRLDLSKDAEDFW